MISSALIVAMAAWEVAYAIWDAAPLDHRESSNLVDINESRLAPVRRKLQERGVPGTVGYYFFVPWKKPLLPEYFSSQYALVPRVIDWQYASYDWVVVNLRTQPHLSLPPKFTIVDDFGDGVYLLKKDVR